MSKLDEKLSELQDIAQHPEAQLQNFIVNGKKVIGCMPYFCPEELVFASGMIPFGLLGVEMQASEAKRYWPSFICSVLQNILELGIRGDYQQMTAVMIPSLCDGLKGMDGNWRHAVHSIPVIPVAHAQNRKMKAGVSFTASQYRKIRERLEELSCQPISDIAILEAIHIYNERRAVMRRFIQAVSYRPGCVKPSQRSAVFKSSFYMDVSAHSAKVLDLTKLIENQPTKAFSGIKVVTSGITAYCSWLMDILDDIGIAVINDEVTNESLRFMTDVPLTEDPIIGLAQQISEIEGCSVLYDPKKNRGTLLIDLCRSNGADGVLLIQTKFCDPEEYDSVPLKNMLTKAGIPCLLIEIDQQTHNNEQARIMLEAFVETLR